MYVIEAREEERNKTGKALIVGRPQDGRFRGFDPPSSVDAST